MKSIYLLLTKANTCVSKMISLTTDDKYSHISLSFEKNLFPLYSFSRKYSNFPLPAGLMEEKLQEGFYMRNHHIPCALYELQVEDDVYEAAKQKVSRMFEEQDKYTFNILGLMLCRIDIPLDREYKYFCSEFISEVLISSYAMELPKLPSLMRPQDFTELNDLQCVFTGQLAELIKVYQIPNSQISQDTLYERVT